MDYLPIFTDLKKRPCLVVGGGDIALRKARMLIKAGADVSLITDNANSEFSQLIEQGVVKHIADQFEPEHLNPVFLAIAATENREIDGRVYQAANQRQVLVNVVDDPKRCSFIIPSIVDRSPIMIAISSSGKAPVLARLLREKLEAILPQHLGQMANIAGGFRQTLKKRIHSFSERRHFWEKAFNGRFADLVAVGKERCAEQELHHLMTQQSAQQSQTRGDVALIGAGPGDPGLLTLRALQLMQQADVVLYDYLVSDEIMELARRDAQLVCVGKKAGFHSVPQETTNQLLVKYAQQGKKVVRMKGGDPFMFGRGGEELEVLFEANIPFQVVPGITAAAGATAYAGIPLTHRDHAQSAIFITGHEKKERNTVNWKAAAVGNQTLVIYMGLMKSSHIQQQLIKHGRSANTPIAIIERGTQATQKVFKGQLHQLAQLAENAASPSLIVIGEVVTLSDKLQWFGEHDAQLQRMDAVANLV